MAADPHLDQLARQLAAMPPQDRGFVLDQLGDGEMRVLAPYLESLVAQPMSRDLGDLAARCVDGDAPDSVRPLAAAAIATAVRSTQAGSTAVAGRPAGGLSLRARAADLLARR